MNEKEKKKFVKELFYKHCITEHHTLTMFNEQFENAIKEYDKAIQVEARVSPKVADTMHQISLRVYKSELVDLIGSLTYDNRNFRKDAWSMFDAERLIMAGETIKNALEKQ